MDVTTVVALVKERLGIRSAVRDSYLIAIAKSIITELQDEKGVTLEQDNDNHLIFVVDYATWRYQSVSAAESGTSRSPISMPRHLQYRLHNLILHNRRPAP